MPRRATPYVSRSKSRKRKGPSYSEMEKAFADPESVYPPIRYKEDVSTPVKPRIIRASKRKKKI